MARLIIEILKSILISVAAIYFVSYCFSDLLTYGESRFQSFIVFSFYFYCAFVLFRPSQDKLFHVLSIPVFTQFIHIFQKSSFETGSNSIWRLLPFLLLNCYFMSFFARSESGISNLKKQFLFFWIVIHAFFLLISPNLEMIIGGGILLFLFTLPLYFAYLNFLKDASDFGTKLEMYLFLLFIIMAAGTFGLIYFASGYKETNNLLATRNIADMNVTMAYFILLWPFVIYYARRQQFPEFLILLPFGVFTALVILSFSRGAVLLVFPYLLITTFRSKTFYKWFITISLLIYFFRSALIRLFEENDLLYFWSLRFGDLLASDSFWDKLQSTSGRSEIQNIAYELFLQRPLTGHGIGSFELLGPGFREAHSLYYTLLAEQGIFGAAYTYFVFVLLAVLLFRSENRSRGKILFASLFAYFVFNHTVGSVFVIIPGKSISVNCLAPILLMCIYFYVANSKNQTSHKNKLRPHVRNHFKISKNTPYWQTPPANRRS